MSKEPTLPDSGERSEFETGAVRDASYGKGFPSLLPPDALRAVSRRFEDGARKYGRNNWQKGIPLSRYVDSLYRHLWAYLEGDTEEDHGGAIIWNAMCLLQTDEWIKTGRLPATLQDLRGELDETNYCKANPEDGEGGRESRSRDKEGGATDRVMAKTVQSDEGPLRWHGAEGKEPTLIPDERLR